MTTETYHFPFETLSSILDFQQAKTNHLLFKSRLRAILYGAGDATDRRVLSQYACAVGAWLYSHALIHYESIPEIHELEEVHSQLHKVARELIGRYQQGNVTDAREGLSDMEQLADKFVELLRTVEENVNAIDFAPDSPAKPEEPVDSKQALQALLAQNELLDSRIKAQTDPYAQYGHKIGDKQLGLYNFFMQAPASFCILRGPEHIYELANPDYQKLIGGRNPLGKPIRQALPELEGQGFYELLDTVYTTQQPYAGKGVQISLLDELGQARINYLDFIYQPTVDSQGETDGILVFAYNVTEQVLARQTVEESENRFRSLVAEAPVATCLLTGREMLIEVANQAIIDIWGKDERVIGKPLAVAIPELEGQPFLDILDGVFTTGKAYSATGALATHEIKGELKDSYVDFDYKPLRDADGVVVSILVSAMDVTERVIASRELEKSEAALRGAIELAELGTWQIDLTTGVLDYSERLRVWCGIGMDELITVERAYQPIREADRPLVKSSMLHAITPGTNGIYDVEYSLDAEQAGQERIIRAQGKAFFNDQGKAYLVSGTAQDVTEQRSIQHLLERRVQERTEELAATNEELAATVEELATTNEELTAANDETAKANKGLEEANLHLTRSNQNLQQFAYIASHDLQEPLRKIQQFGDLLKTRYAASLGEEQVYLERMQSAASRMSLLIKDLLAFSRISTRQVITATVPLAKVLDETLDNLSVSIGETKAQILVDDLPTVQGDASQLGQLFLNLLSNAIKFSCRDSLGNPAQPKISIRADKVPADALPGSIKPARQASDYYRVEIVDNGIGFDEKYTDRIFQVFQRLHSKNEFAGSGVGLAICEKVVVNHGGAITATSKPSEGATFSVYLPI